MTTISSFWFMILIELLVVTTLAAIVLVALKFIREQRDRTMAKQLMQRIKEDRERRKKETIVLMQQKFGFEQEAAEEIAVKSEREERKFYQSVINFYLRRDAHGFENLNIDFEGAVDPCRSLEPPGQGDSAAADAAAVNESEEIRRLEIENKRLSDEVGVTMQTMSRMLDEYSSMFAGGTEDGAPKQEVMQQLQGSGEDKAAASTETNPESDTESEVADEGDLFAEHELEAEDDIVVESESESESEDEPEDELFAEFEADVTGVLDEGSEPETEQAMQEAIDVAKEPAPQQVDTLVEGMDDLSDLDPSEDDDLMGEEGPENPDELIG